MNVLVILKVIWKRSSWRSEPDGTTSKRITPTLTHKEIVPNQPTCESDDGYCRSTATRRLKSVQTHSHTVQVSIRTVYIKSRVTFEIIDPERDRYGKRVNCQISVHIVPDAMPSPTPTQTSSATKWTQISWTQVYERFLPGR